MQLKKKFLVLIFSFLVLIIAMHALAMNFFLYWKVGWFDMLMHFLGGAWLALVAGWIIYFSGKVRQDLFPYFFSLLFIVTFSVFGGVIWEFTEFFWDQIVSKNGYHDFLMQLGIKDTMSDLFFDLFGGLVAGLVLIKKIRKNEKQNF